MCVCVCVCVWYLFLCVCEYECKPWTSRKLNCARNNPKTQNIYTHIRISFHRLFFYYDTAYFRKNIPKLWNILNDKPAFPYLIKFCSNDSTHTHTHTHTHTQRKSLNFSSFPIQNAFSKLILTNKKERVLCMLRQFFALKKTSRITPIWSIWFGFMAHQQL